MTRFRLRTGPIALFGAVFVLALIVLLPLRLVLGWFDLESSRVAAREATGSVWFGGVREAQVGQIALGDLGARLSPFPLAVGRARIDLTGQATPGAESGARTISGAVSVSRHAVGIDDMTARLPAGNVFAPLPVTGLDLDDVSVRYRDGNCDKADGRVKAVLGGDLGGIALGQGLSGNARCDAGALLLPLASQSGSEHVDLRLWQNGRFVAQLTVRASDPTVAQKLELSGFRPTSKGHMLSINGNF
ncbi:type II secretion system protein N [Sphingomonas sp. PAMC 26617]|uniref:type II secretion system protein N n=1 Tax=Sphingomonas sp. PAMC 26617 TaxID=1112216 RepID=UPI000287D83D|nr:type II secretion system protein N [Sphingomonas sp. PAMC 26617]